MGEWVETKIDDGKSITESKVVSIADLQEKYASYSTIGCHKLPHEVLIVTGTVVSVHLKTPRLLFITVERVNQQARDENMKDNNDNERFQLIIKERDNFYSQVEIAALFNSIKQYQTEILQIHCETYLEITCSCRDSAHFTLSTLFFFHVRKFSLLKETNLLLTLTTHSPHTTTTTTTTTNNNHNYTNNGGFETNNHNNTTTTLHIHNNNNNNNDNNDNTPLEINIMETTGRKKSKKRKREKRSNKNRASKFAEWVLETYQLYPYCLLQILDVAGGGHGALSFDLYFKYHINSVIVDPRPVLLESKQKSYLNISTSSLLTLSSSSSSSSSSTQTTTTQTTLYHHPQIGVNGDDDDSKIICIVNDNVEFHHHAIHDTDMHCTEDNNNNANNNNTNTNTNTSVEINANYDDNNNKCDQSNNIGIEKIVEQCDGYRQVKDWFNREFLQSTVGCKLWEESTLILGLHPDQATEDIVDFALESGKPFAVIPCCVFPKLFPKRCYNNNQVKYYEEFCDYLQAKHHSILRTTLPFSGRNIVLYSLPTRE